MRITIVGGSIDVRNALADIFGLERWDVITVATMTDAVRELRDRRLALDAIFLVDAGVDGSEASALLGLLRELRVKSILLGHSRRCREVARARGVPYVDKPFDVDELVSMVRSLDGLAPEALSG